LSEAPIEIKNLVEKFNRNLDAYKNPSYKEEQLKQEFINPFFKALGWDVDNVSGAAPQYRDVIFEDSIKVGGGTKAPDYCFTMAGRKMFFVEAKKPSVNVKMSIEPSYQLRRYAWSAKLPLSILTDFEELAVYESRTKPQKKDRASTARIMFLTYQDYLEKWDEIYSIFSREAVLQGSFDKFAEATKKKKGTTEVDDSFLSEIEEWRDLFAKNIALRNPEITIEELNYAVQQIIDRIVFLRMCEDRGAEKYEQLRNLLDDDHIYHRFGELCLKADDKYNSGLFHFREVKGRGTPPDNLTLSLNIDDKIFKTIIKGLYYPNSPYEFSVLSPEILGNVYEQFLGKVIRLTPGHQAKIEEKPEVKKAGGVYYTPQYIVDYIVKNTVGKLCKGKTPNKVSKLRILDPACGSGSFLLGAYTYLLKWHRDYYTNQKDKKRLKDKIYQGKGGEYYLTIREKKRILLNNIYGVDIDPQAVNVTKLSLLLKVLEGENRDALEAQQKLFKERALPDLGENIKCGNSLIGPDIYDDPDLVLDVDDLHRINPFDWKSEFSNVIDDGGFDAVIGNPPYIRIQALQKYQGNEIKYFKSKYKSAKGKYDIYVLFLEKSTHLIRKKGLLGMIVPNKFIISNYGDNIRDLLIETGSLHEIVSFEELQIFESASIYTCLLFWTNNKKRDNFSYVEFYDITNITNDLHRLNQGDINSFNRANLKLPKVGEKWHFTTEKAAQIVLSLYYKWDTFKSFASRIFQGIITGGDNLFIFERIGQNGDNYILYSQEFNEKFEIEKELLHPFLRGSNIKSYFIKTPVLYIFYPYILINNKTIYLSEEEIQNNFHLAWNYLKKAKKKMDSRGSSRMKYPIWYALWNPRDLRLLKSPKILVPTIAAKPSFGIDIKGEYFFLGSGAGGPGAYGLIIPEGKENPMYALGLLNSIIANIFINTTSSVFRGGYRAYSQQFIWDIPFRPINFDNSDDVALHDRMVTLVEQMLQLHKGMENTKTPDAEQKIVRQIDAIDKQIDNLVYKLFDLTEEEIKIIDNF
jgi:type I restriction-modification system DNA methylase subunit